MKPLPSRLSIVTNCRCFKIISDETPTFQTIYINKLLLLFEIISDQTPSTFHTVNMLQDHFWLNSSLPFTQYASRSFLTKPLSTFQTVSIYKLLLLCFKIICEQTPVYLSDCLHLHTPSWQPHSSADTWVFSTPSSHTLLSGQRSFSY